MGIFNIFTYIYTIKIHQMQRYLGVSKKIGVFPPKMDSLFHGKTPINPWMI